MTDLLPVTPAEMLAEAEREVAMLKEALAPFAAEGRRWDGTPSRHDGLKLLVAEDGHLLHAPERVSKFTIGDLKRAVAVMEAIADRLRRDVG